MKKFENKTVIITGGSRGIGLELSKTFANKGARVISGARSYTFNHKDFDESIIKQHLDVSNPQSVEKFFIWVEQKIGKIDVLINNAGVGFFAPFIDLREDQWLEMLNVNLSGTFRCMQSACKIMLKNDGGRIFNIGSVADTCIITSNSGYSASKNGVKALEGIVNEELKANAIRVTHISLGAVFTDIWKNRDNFSKIDMLSVQEVADFIIFLAMQPLNIRIDKIEIVPPKRIL